MVGERGSFPEQQWWDQQGVTGAGEPSWAWVPCGQLGAWLRAPGILQSEDQGSQVREEESMKNDQ